MSSEAVFVGELDAPEAAGGVEDFDTKIEPAVVVGFTDANNAKFAGFEGEAVEDLDASAKRKGERGAEKRAAAADGDGFGGGVEGFARGEAAEYADGNADQDAAGTAALNHRAC